MKILNTIMTSSVVLAAISSTYSLEPNEFRIGKFSITPTLDVEYLVEDNVLLTSRNETESKITLISPQVKMILDHDSRKYFIDLGLKSQPH